MGIKDRVDGILKSRGEMARELGSMREECAGLCASLKEPNDKKAADKCLADMDGLIKRFDRDRLDIVLDGQAHHGKTTFAMSASGLEFLYSLWIRMPIKLSNNPEMAEGTASAYITFKQQEDLVDTVKAYINQIDPSYDLSDFKFFDIGSPSTECMLREMQEKQTAVTGRK